MTVTIHQGDVREILPELPDGCVDCIVTSPPYYGLRDYGVAGQIGLEATPAEYVATLVAVFRECRRVLRDDGTLWLNMGDAYAGSWGSQGRQGNTGQMASRAVADARQRSKLQAARIEAGVYPSKRKRTGSMPIGSRLKPKDLMGMPWALAFALRQDGWYLRQDIIWAKPNPMPESVRDRCTKAHEYLFLLSKSPRYYYDREAIAEPLAASSIERLSQPNIEQQAGSDRVPRKTNGAMKAVFKPPRIGGNKYGDDDREQSRTKSGKAWVPRRAHPIGNAGGGRHSDEGRDVLAGVTRNKRSVWEIATQPFTGAHFATFPPALVEPCILAGCRSGGTVLDPFSGAGTVGLVADRLQRDALLVELNPEYVEIERRRIHADSPLLAEVING